MACLDDNTLAEYVEGTALPEVVARVEVHVDECPRCRALIADVIATGSRDCARSFVAGADSTVFSAGANASPLGQAILSAGSQVGRFLVLEPIGLGGMGVVYSAHDPKFDRRVAIKLMRADGAGDAQRFEREARILSEIDHPRIVRHVEHGRLPSGEAYIVMEWLEGEDLAARLARGSLTAAESVAMCIDVAQALGALHERGIVHRDLKPSNLFLQGGLINQVKLLDFGIAHIAASMRMTGTGVLVGTLAYMAPEQATGAKILDARVDVFALGCVLFESIAGTPAFTGENAMAILTKILFEEAPRLGERCAGVPHDLAALVDRMLSKDPAARPRDGRAVADALRALGEIPSRALLPLPETTRPASLTDSEQQALAVILVGPPEAPLNPSAIDDGWLETEAKAHGATSARLLDGSLALLLSGRYVATDLAAQAARCALALTKHIAGRRIALGVGQSWMAGALPIGPAIDRAARLLELRKVPVSLTEINVIGLDDVVAGLLDARFDVREESGVFALYGERELAEGTRTLLGKATPCVGRERELRQIERAFNDCLADSEAQVVLVTAPAGTGKSRLMQEFLRQVRTRGNDTSIWIGRADSLRAGSPLGLLSHALRGAFEIQEGEPIDVRRNKVRAAVAERVVEKDRRRVSEFLGEICGALFPDEDSPPLQAARTDAQLMGDQMRAAFHDFVKGTSAHRPLVIVLEDMHWGDRATGQFLDHALKELEAQAIFLLVLARPEVNTVFPDLWAKRRRQEIRLTELSQKAIERLARHVLGDRVTAETIEQMAKLSEGNAFYLEELLRWAAEGKTGQLPQTLVAMVQTRLGTLDDESRKLLRAASVFGEVFWPGAVASLLGGAAQSSNVRDRIADLVSREVFVKRSSSRFSEENEVAFRHALLREGAYATLTAEDLALGHRLAGGWLEEHGEQDTLLLAEHFEKGGEGEKAGRYYSRAAQQAHGAGDSAAALAHARRGIALGVSGDLRIALLGQMCDVLYFSMWLDDALPYARELLESARLGSGPWLQAMTVELVCALQQGRIDDFDAAVAKLFAIEPTAENAYLFTNTMGVTMYLLDTMGRVREANRLVENLCASIDSFAVRMPSTALILQIIRSARELFGNENPARGLSLIDSAPALAETLGLRRYIATAMSIRQLHLWLLGAADVDRLIAGWGVADEETATALSLRPFLAASILAASGQFDDARAWANRLVRAGAVRRAPTEEGLGRWALAEVERRAGNLDVAENEIHAALPLLRMSSPMHVPGALATLAAVRLQQGRLDESIATAEEGLERYASMGVCSLFMRGAFLRLVHVECLEAAGRHEEARSALAEARRRLLTNANKIEDPTYRKSFLENVSENRRTLELSRQWLGDHDP